MDTGQNDQNRLVPFATVGNLEKFYEAETIYIDNLDQASIGEIQAPLVHEHRALSRPDFHRTKDPFLCFLKFLT